MPSPLPLPSPLQGIHEEGRDLFHLPLPFAVLAFTAFTGLAVAFTSAPVDLVILVVRQEVIRAIWFCVEFAAALRAIVLTLFARLVLATLRVFVPERCPS